MYFCICQIISLLSISTIHEEDGTCDEWGITWGKKCYCGSNFFRFPPSSEVDLWRFVNSHIFWKGIIEWSIYPSWSDAIYTYLILSEFLRKISSQHYYSCLGWIIVGGDRCEAIDGIGWWDEHHRTTKHLLTHEHTSILGDEKCPDKVGWEDPCPLFHALIIHGGIGRYSGTVGKMRESSEVISHRFKECLYRCLITDIARVGRCLDSIFANTRKSLLCLFRVTTWGDDHMWTFACEPECGSTSDSLWATRDNGDVILKSFLHRGNNKVEEAR